MNPKIAIVLAAVGLFFLSTRSNAAAASTGLYGATKAGINPGTRAYLANPSVAAQYASMNGKLAGNTQDVQTSRVNALTSLVNSGIRLFGGTVQSGNFTAESPNAGMTIADQYSSYGAANTNALNVAQQYAQYGAGRVAGVTAALPDYMPSVSGAYSGSDAAQALWAQEHADQAIIDGGANNNGWGEG